jgi:CSLREA domain-containing protein
LPAGIRALAALFALAGCLFFTAVAGAAPLVVTKTGDTSDGKCNKDCSLREAIDAANGSDGSDTIKLKAKTYKLTVEGAGEDDNETGDLDVLGPTTIKGRGAKRTVIQGAWSGESDRLTELSAGPASLRISGMTLTGGDVESENGGAVYAPYGANAVTVTNARISKNEADFTGGIESYGELTVSKTVFSHNHSDSCCAAAYNYGSAELTDVTFDHNTATSDTGAFYDEGSSAVLKNVTFSNNTAGSVGGAMISNAGGTELTNVTFSGNHAAGNGGAFYAESGSTTTMNNTTITGNETEGNGGGIYDNTSGSTVWLDNSILAGNQDLDPDSINAPDCGGLFWSSHGYVLLGTDAGCSHLNPIVGFQMGDPKLKPLADNGGFNKTHALKGSSPAKNAGNPANPGSDPTACAPKDQRGVKRPQKGRCDLGAYELK